MKRREAKDGSKKYLCVYIKAKDAGHGIVSCIIMPLLPAFTTPINKIHHLDTKGEDEKKGKVRA